MSIYNKLPINMHGHAKAYYADEPNSFILDKDNAIHPQNMARVIARALSNESNYYVYKIAFGNGGTVVDAAYNITYKPPNTGMSPDLAEWRSRLYNEVYYEIVDDSNVLITYGPGAAPSSDPASAAHDPSGPGVTSRELGLVSEVVIKCTLNEDEPVSQFNNDLIGLPGISTEQTEASFVFDEIGLFTTGLPLTATHGYQFVDVSMRMNSNDSGLSVNTTYSFSLYVNGTLHNVNFTTPSVGSGSTGEILYSDVISSLNAVLPNCQVSLNNGTDAPNLLNPENVNTLTYGYLKFTSDSTGDASTITINDLTSVKAATIGSNIDLATNGLASIDIVVLNEGDLVLVKDQVNASENGVYVASAGQWVRATSADSPSEVEFLTQNSTVFVTHGAVNALTHWNQISTSIVLGSTSIIFQPVTTNWLFHYLDGFVGFLPNTPGLNAGVQNNPNFPATEASRMLTHLIFSPIHKTKNRTLIIEYTLTISVAESVDG